MNLDRERIEELHELLDSEDRTADQLTDVAADLLRKLELISHLAESYGDGDRVPVETLRKVLAGAPIV